MDSFIIVIAIFVSIFLATIMLVYTSIVGKLHKEIDTMEREQKRLLKENKELRDELHFHLNYLADLQKSNNIYHEELKKVYMSATNYWLDVRTIICKMTMEQIYNNKVRTRTFAEMEEIAFENYMKSLFK